MVAKIRGSDERVRDAGENLTVVVRAAHTDEQRLILLRTFVGLKKGIASAAAGWVNALLSFNTALAKFQDLEPEITPLVDRILAAHEAVISISKIRKRYCRGRLLCLINCYLRQRMKSRRWRKMRRRKIQANAVTSSS